jgi:hypothetical protein
MKFASIAAAGLIGLMIFLPGCITAQSNSLHDSPDTGGYDPSRFTSEKIGMATETELRDLTNPQVIKLAKYPKTAHTEEWPKFQVHYDKVRDVTDVSVFGNIYCTSPIRDDITQGYWATWETHGKVGPDTYLDAKEWDLVDMHLVETQFPEN